MAATDNGHEAQKEVTGDMAGVDILAEEGVKRERKSLIQ